MVGVFTDTPTTFLPILIIFDMMSKMHLQTRFYVKLCS